LKYKKYLEREINIKKFKKAKLEQLKEMKKIKKIKKMKLKKRFHGFNELSAGVKL
jgi:ribosomal protein RSM22 (predicted rRNA methylase)